MNKFALVAALVVLALLGIVMSYATTMPEKSACIIYASAVSLFLAIQIFAFVSGHTRYSEELEAAKFDLLENEEKEWRN